MLGWWLLAYVITHVEVINWVFTLRQPSTDRARSLPRQVRDSIRNLTLLTYALAHVGGPIGAVFARLPQWPNWVCIVLEFFLALEVLYLICWLAYQLYTRRLSPPPAPAMSLEGAPEGR